MWGIKLTAIGLLLSIFSYGQTDTTWLIISGNSIYENMEYERELKTTYTSITTFELDTNEILYLTLWDDCDVCYDNIKFEKIRLICMYKQYPGDRYYYYSESGDISTIHYGNEYTRIEVYPPVSFLDPKLGQSYILESNYKNLKL